MRRQAEPEARALGAAIRRRRRSLGMTLVQVAAVTGLSHPFLSQLERGRTRGSMRSLFLVAEALRTSQQALLAEAQPVPDGAEPVVLTVNDTTSIPVDAGSARLLVEAPGQFAVTEFRLRPQEFSEFYVHEHAELVYVASGTVEAQVRSGSEPHVLGPRDVLRIPGSVPHRWRAFGAAEAVVLVTHTFAS
ncbi:XRE family transcriptional regulator [Cryptosporangium japonicum]|uniref:XRE family transcriptional regulator n=1 Tax=Cryptosporangium japonicum TaxID=80872 RepID=A0ABN0V0I2_9ACTN